MSHEFRTALTGIQGFSELICEEANEHLIEIKEFASSINKDALRLTDIVSTLLDFDQMQAGTLTLRPERINMNALIKESVEQITLVAPHHHLHLELDVTLPLVMGDTESGPAQKFGQMILLKVYQRLGYFPKPEIIPGAIISHIRRSQLQPICPKSR